MSSHLARAALIAATSGALAFAAGYLLGQRRRKPRRIIWADKYCKRVLFSEEEIQAAIADLAQRLNRDYCGPRKSPPIIIGVLSGVLMTLADLARQLEFEHDIDFIRASSYTRATTPQEVQMATTLKFDVAGRDVIVVDELVDSAKTLSSIVTTLRGKRALSVKTVCVLDKVMCHKVPFRPDYHGLDCPDDFVFGYGMDCQERFRSLPFVAVATEAAKKGHDDGREAQQVGERLKRWSSFRREAGLDKRLSG